MSRVLGRIATAILSLSTVAEMGLAQVNISTTFIFESFIYTRPGTQGVKNRASWIYGEAQLNRSTKLVGSYLDFPIAGYTVKDQNGADQYVPGSTLHILDEAFLETRFDDKVVRMGRIRSRFGFDDWSELFYTPIAQAPMVRTNPINNLALLRFDTGFDIQGGRPDFEYQVGMVDTSNDGWQIAPKRLDHASARVQFSRGDLIVGLNGLSKIQGGGNRDTMAAIDLRWTRPNLIVRAEVDKGFDQGSNGEGGYIDVFYRPQGMFRTQFGIREEAYNSPSGMRSSLTTVGFRHILSPEMALNVNYGWGNDVGPALAMRGWTVQLMTAVRF